jgi:hypothetical protein
VSITGRILAEAGAFEKFYRKIERLTACQIKDCGLFSPNVVKETSGHGDAAD